MGLCALALLLAGGNPLRASEPARNDTATHSVSLQEFNADVQRMQGLVAACAAQATACDAGQVPGDEQVGEAGGGFELHWGWLRSAVRKARDAKPADRQQGMRDAGEQLGEMANESRAGAAAQPTDAAFAKARDAANSVLRTAEFENDQGPTWWERKKAQFTRWLGRIFLGVGALGEMAPWLGRLLEWVFFLGAATGLVVILLRTLARQRQRMRVALGEGGPLVTAWQREANDWARMAQQHADAAEWREAVHCLYWAAIVLLEGRRAWRHNPTRTPREYVRLLKPGSARQQGLRGLTQIFERVWYGLRDADAEEYRRALAFFRQLDGDAAPATEASQPGAAGATA
jgi:hypothetical protein